MNTIGRSKSLYFKTYQNRKKSLIQTEVKNHPYCEKKRGKQKKTNNENIQNNMTYYFTTYAHIQFR